LAQFYPRAKRIQALSGFGKGMGKMVRPDHAAMAKSVPCANKRSASAPRKTRRTVSAKLAFMLGRSAKWPWISAFIASLAVASILPEKKLSVQTPAAKTRNNDEIAAKVAALASPRLAGLGCGLS
jgi:hypothetical protein